MKYATSNFIILIIDCTTPYYSICVVSNDCLIGRIQSTAILSHAKSLTMSIQELMDSYSLSYSDLSAVAINEGPGSFTGLRVASATAKGICFSLDIPLISIPGLDIYAQTLAARHYPEYSDVMVMIDARRSNYFYAHSREGQLLVKSCFQSMIEIEKNIAACVHPLIIKSEEPIYNQMIDASLFSTFVVEQYNHRNFVDIFSFQPNYYLNSYEK